MDLITLSIAIIVFISIVVGFTVGNLFPVLRPLMTYEDELGKKEKTHPISEVDLGELDELAEELATENQTSSNRPQKPLPPQSSGYPKMVQITRLFRDTEQYKLHVELDGALYAGIETMDAAQKDSLNRAVLELRSWVDESAPPPAPIEIEKIIKRPANLLPNTPELAQPDDESVKPVEPVAVTMNPIQLVANAVQANSQPAPKTRNIAEEVNAILQTKVAGTKYEEQGIEIAMTIQGTLAFVVGSVAHEFMDEIEDPEIRTLMQAAVRQWDEISDD